MTGPIRVLLVDDHQMFADALELLLASEEGIESLGAVASGEQMVEVCERECPDVVLMDIDLPGMDGVDATRLLTQLCPDAQVVAITALQPGDVMARVIEAGATGFVPKTQAADLLIDVIRRAAIGEIVLPAQDTVALLLRLGQAHERRADARRLTEQLTEREVEILQAIADGRSTDEIAREMFISPHTVHSHVGRILTKLGLHSKLEAVLFSLREGLIRLSQG
jgi:NarL family two-component system response regulator LiaR